MSEYRELTLGETAPCEHCGKTITVHDGGHMGYYWCHVESDKIACFPIPGVWTKPRAHPRGES